MVEWSRRAYHYSTAIQVDGWMELVTQNPEVGTCRQRRRQAGHRIGSRCSRVDIVRPCHYCYYDYYYYYIARLEIASRYGWFDLVHVCIHPAAWGRDLWRCGIRGKVFFSSAHQIRTNKNDRFKGERTSKQASICARALKCNPF